MADLAVFWKSGFPAPRTTVSIVIGASAHCLPYLMPGRCAGMLPFRSESCRMGPELAGRSLRILGADDCYRSASPEARREDLNEGGAVSWPGECFSNPMAFPGAPISYYSGEPLSGDRSPRTERIDP